MSGPRLTRRVTVEGNKKVAELEAGSPVHASSGSSSYNPRRSVFERLGGVDRSKPRESYQPERCRNWLRDGRCLYGNNCKFLHGPFTDPKPRTKSVRNVIQGGSRDRSEEADERHYHSRTRSLDSVEFGEDDVREIHHKQKKHRLEEEVSDLPTKKPVKVKKRRTQKDETEGVQDDEGSRKRKRKTHKKRDVSPKVVTKPCSPKDEVKDWGYDGGIHRQGKSEVEWEEQGELDYEKQLALEKRRQDLQRQLALMDEEDAAAEEGDWKGKEARKEHEEEHRRVPVVHSRLHPEPSITPPSEVSPSAPPQPVPKKKKKKKSETESKSSKLKKEAAPRKKDEGKRRVLQSTDEDEFPRKDMRGAEEVARKVSGSERSKSSKGSYSQEMSGDDMETSEHHPPQNEPKRALKSALESTRERRSLGDLPYNSPTMYRGEEPQRKRPQVPLEEDPRSRHELFSPEVKATKARRQAALSTEADDPPARHHDDGRARKVQDSRGDFYHGPRDQPEEYEQRERVRDENRKARSPGVTAADDIGPPTDERRKGEESRPSDRGHRGDVDGKAFSRGPRTPSPGGPPRGRRSSPKGEGDRYFYEEDPDEVKKKRYLKGIKEGGPCTPPGEPSFEMAMLREDGHGRSRHGDPHLRGPRTPSDEERGFSPTTQHEATRSNRFSEREGEITRRVRDTHREQETDRDQGYPERGRGEGEFDRRKPREEAVIKGRNTTEDYPRTRVHDEDFPRGRPREVREEEFVRPREREGKEDDYQKGRFREDRPEEFPKPRARDERDDEFSRPRGRDERDEDMRGRPPRDYHRRPHEDPEGHEQDIRDERERRRPDVIDSTRGRERSGDRGRDSRPEYHRRPSPSPPGPPRSAPHGPPRGRSPPHRFDDRRRMDDGFRPGPGRDMADDRRRMDDGFRPGPGRDMVGRGRGAVGRGRGGYPPPYDNRGKPGDTRRRTPPPVPPRPYQERERGPPPRPYQNRDVLPGRGRGYIDNKGRPPGDRFREPGASWDRRPDRDLARDRGRPFDEPRDRERRPRESPPPVPGFREKRPWDERRGSPPRGTSPPPHRRVPFDADREGPGRVRAEERERRSLDNEDWEYEEEVGPDRAMRKRARPPLPGSTRSDSPFEPKKPRGSSPDLPVPGLGDISPATDVATRQKGLIRKSPAAKEGKKMKKKKEGKKEGKVARDGPPPDGEVVPEVVTGGIEEGKVVKTEKKQKKEKKAKEKTGKKKSKKAAAAALVSGVVTEQSLGTEGSGVELTGAPTPDGQSQPTEGEPVVLKVGKKRRHAEGEGVKGKEGEKPKKKKKKKHQPEVVVQPWADLEGEDDQQSSAARNESLQKKFKEREQSPDENKTKLGASKGEKTQDEMFSDWSDDDSPGGEDSWFDNNASEFPEDRPMVDDERARKSSTPSTPVEAKGPAFDDVYDPISDDEFDAMYTQSDEEGGEENGAKVCDVEDVDWSSLGMQADTADKDHIPGAHLQRFTPGHVFSRIGISPTLAGRRLTQLVQDACAKAKAVETGKDDAGSGLFVPVEGPKCLGAFVAATAARKRERETLLSNLGPCRRALCARRDLAIRKQLGRSSSKFGKIAMFSSSPTSPIDTELFQMSVALYKKDSASSDNGVRLIPSKVGSILLTQA